MKIQLLHFEGCPYVEAARAAVREALIAEKIDLAVEEIDVEDPVAPPWARGWGSPTVLVDGEDIAGQQPASSAACRLYAGGAPSVEAIRVAVRRRAEPAKARIALPMLGAITTAIAASACCLVPAVLAIAGVSGAGFAARFAPYRTYFLIATGVALAAGFWFAYRPRRDACGCALPRSGKATRVGLWLTTLLAIGLAAYPRLGGGTATAGSGGAAATAELRLEVTGINCKECTSTIANRIRTVPGVVSATVDFESGEAVVRYDGRDGMTTAAIGAVEDAGFHASVQR